MVTKEETESMAMLLKNTGRFPVIMNDTGKPGLVTSPTIPYVGYVHIDRFMIELEKHGMEVDKSTLTVVKKSASKPMPTPRAQAPPVKVEAPKPAPTTAPAPKVATPDPKPAPKAEKWTAEELRPMKRKELEALAKKQDIATDDSLENIRTLLVGTEK
jgi:hypothetical protein